MKPSVISFHPDSSHMLPINQDVRGCWLRALTYLIIAVSRLLAVIIGYDLRLTTFTLQKFAIEIIVCDY